MWSSHMRQMEPVEIEKVAAREKSGMRSGSGGARIGTRRLMKHYSGSAAETIEDRR